MGDGRWVEGEMMAKGGLSNTSLWVLCCLRRETRHRRFGFGHSQDSGLSLVLMKLEEVARAVSSRRNRWKSFSVPVNLGVTFFSNAARFNNGGFLLGGGATTANFGLVLLPPLGFSLGGVGINPFRLHFLSNTTR